MKKITEIPLHIFLFVIYFLIKVTKVEDIILYSIIMDNLKDHNKTTKFCEDILKNKSNQDLKESNIVVEDIPQNSKKQELIDSLNYLKSKSVKSKQDKESIYSLEMVLKNM